MMGYEPRRGDLPKDFKIYSEGNKFTLSATLQTQHELRAVVWALSLLNSGLSSHRQAVASDFGLAEPTPPTLRDQLVEAGIMIATTREGEARG
jgi:hypothetical protein